MHVSSLTMTSDGSGGLQGQRDRLARASDRGHGDVGDGDLDGPITVGALQCLGGRWPLRAKRGERVRDVAVLD